MAFCILHDDFSFAIISTKDCNNSILFVKLLFPFCCLTSNADRYTKNIDLKFANIPFCPIHTEMYFLVMHKTKQEQS